MHHPGLSGSETCQGPDKRHTQFPVINTHELHICPGWIGEGAKDIEDCADTKLATRPCRIFHGRMQGRRKQKADTDGLNAPGHLFRLMNPTQQKALFENTARAMGDAPRMIKIRHIGNCLKADPGYGAGVAEALDIPLSEVPKA
jgi:catalase